MAPDEAAPHPTDELQALLLEARPEVNRICARYCLAPEQADAVVYQAVMTLGDLWERLAGQDRRRWYLEAVEAGCRNAIETETTEGEEN